MDRPAPVLQLRNLSKSYPGHRAVHRVSLEVEQGEFFSLLGPSGCGKTTMLRLVGGFEEPSEGEIVLNGRDITRKRPYERNVNTVFQNYALFPHLNVRRNVEFGLKRKSVDDAARRVREVLELVRLTGKEERYPAQLSGGERQRAALARSLVLEPDVLLLDEPLSALDPNLRKQVRSELQAVQRRTGIAFLFVTHDQEEALSMSDRIAVMCDGAIQQTGSPRELYVHPRTRFVASFLGQVNWIDGVGVRPESIRLAGEPPPGGVLSRTATVLCSTFLGNRVQVQARLSDGGVVLAELSHPARPFTEGETAHLWWRPADELRPAE